MVAALAAAWIEIHDTIDCMEVTVVAALAAAWIEIVL